MKRMYQKEKLGMPRECLNEKHIILSSKTLSTNTTIELDDLVPNWKDYDRIVINADNIKSTINETLYIHVTNNFTGCLIVEGLKSETLLGPIGISQGEDENSPILSGIYARVYAGSLEIYDTYTVNSLVSKNFCASIGVASGEINGTCLSVYNKIAKFSSITFIEI